MKKFLSVISALIFSGAIAVAANVPLLTGPVDPGNIRGVLNGLIQSINTNVGGLVFGAVNSVLSPATQIESTAYSMSLPANYLSTNGQSLKISCWGNSASKGADSRIAKLYFGASSISTASITDINKNWILNAIVTRTGAAQQSFFGNGQHDTTMITPGVSTGTDALTAAVTIKCTSITVGTLGDLEFDGMVVQSIK